MRYLKTALLAIILMTSALIIPGTSLVSASCPQGATAVQCDACGGLNQLGGTGCSDSNGPSHGQNQIAAVAKTIVNILSFIAGIAAVIMIVISGVRFVTSGGESSAVSSAKNTLVYAIIGLVIVALAQVIVHFVLNAILTGSTNTGVT